MYPDVIFTVLHTSVHGPRGIAVLHHVRKATIFASLSALIYQFCISDLVIPIDT